MTPDRARWAFRGPALLNAKLKQLLQGEGEWSGACFATLDEEKTEGFWLEQQDFL